MRHTEQGDNGKSLLDAMTTSAAAVKKAWARPAGIPGTPGGSFIRMPRGGATPFPSPCPRQAEEEQQWRMAGGVEDLGDDELPPAIGVAVLFFFTLEEWSSRRTLEEGQLGFFPEGG